MALNFSRRGNASLKLKSKRKTFKAVHKIIGNGPVMFLANGAKKYFKNQGVTLRSSRIFSSTDVKKAIDKDRPVALLLSKDILNWHWVLCVGYREYNNGQFYMRIIDGWNNTTHKYYKAGIGSNAQWMSTTQYWIK